MEIITDSAIFTSKKKYIQTNPYTNVQKNFSLENFIDIYK